MNDSLGLSPREFCCDRLSLEVEGNLLLVVREVKETRNVSISYPDATQALCVNSHGTMTMEEEKSNEYGQRALAHARLKIKSSFERSLRRSDQEYILEEVLSGEMPVVLHHPMIVVEVPVDTVLDEVVVRDTVVIFEAPITSLILDTVNCALFRRVCDLELALIGAEVVIREGCESIRGLVRASTIKLELPILVPEKMRLVLDNESYAVINGPLIPSSTALTMVELPGGKLVWLNFGYPDAQVNEENEDLVFASSLAAAEQLPSISNFLGSLKEKRIKLRKELIEKRNKPIPETLTGQNKRQKAAAKGALKRRRAK